MRLKQNNFLWSTISLFIPPSSYQHSHCATLSFILLKKLYIFFLILRRLHNDSRNKYNTAVHIKKPSFQDILLLRFLFCAHFVALFIVGVSKFSGAWKSIQDFFLLFLLLSCFRLSSAGFFYTSHFGKILFNVHEKAMQSDFNRNLQNWMFFCGIWSENCVGFKLDNIWRVSTP